MEAMTDSDREYIDNGFAELKKDIKEYVDSVKELFLLRINGVEGDVRRNREDLSCTKDKQDQIENAVTKVTTRMTDHIANHKDGDNSKRATIAIIVSVVAVVSAVLIAIFGG